MKMVKLRIKKHDAERASATLSIELRNTSCKEALDGAMGKKSSEMGE